MRKILPALFACLALGAGGAAVYLFEKPSSGAGSTAAIAYLPSDTVLLLAVPNLNGAFTDFKGSDLFKIWAEPDVQAFLQRPLSKLPPHGEIDHACQQIGKLGLTNLFIAVTSIDEATSDVHAVAGFQFKSPRTDVDALLAKPKAQLRKSYPASKADLINYAGHPVETIVLDEHHSLASVYLGDWYFLSNDLALLEATLDRVEHRGTVTSQPTLDKDPDFVAVTGKLPSAHSTLIYGRAKPFMNRLLDLAAASGQAVDSTERAEVEKTQAFGATTGFEGGSIRDTIYVHAPGISQQFAKLQMSSLPLTTASTIFYASSMLNIPARFDLPAGGPFAAVYDLAAQLGAKGVTLKSFQEGFGNEASIHLDWPEGEAQPSMVATLEVRDYAAAGKYIDNLTRALTFRGKWETSEVDGFTFHTIDLPNVASLAPTLTVTGKHLIFGLNEASVEEAVGREKNPSANFTSGDSYKKASALVQAGNASFVYLDSKAFFERFYGSLKQYAMMAAFLMPQASEYVDFSKLPETETIARHLSPTVYSQTYNPNGYTIESVGTVTLQQAALVTIGGAVGAVMPYLTNSGAGSTTKPDDP